MKKIETIGKQKEPKLFLDLKTGMIKIFGRSTMTNPYDFYPSVINLLEEYCKYPAKKSLLMIDLTYYNTSSAKYLLKIAEVMSSIQKKENYEIKINWYYEPDDLFIEEDIKLISDIIQFKINAIEHECEFA